MTASEDWMLSHDSFSSMTAFYGSRPVHFQSNRSRTFVQLAGTMSPKVNSVQLWVRLIQNGMTVVRLNMSHGVPEEHMILVKTLRDAEKKSGVPLSIVIDLKGPEIRTGRVVGECVSIVKGSIVNLTVDEKYAKASTAKNIFVDLPSFAQAVSIGQRVFIDDGLLELEVISISRENVICTACNSCEISSLKGVNLPSKESGNENSIPTLFKHDEVALQFGMEAEVDQVYVSFTRSSHDIRAVKEYLKGSANPIQVIAKIENTEGLTNLDTILEECDGVLVARGDLGVEIGLDKVIALQQIIVSRATLAGKPSIVATHMLDSMINQPRPTRAEVSDITHTVLDGAGTLLLTGEIAKGKYPHECLNILRGTAVAAEGILPSHCFSLLQQASLQSDKLATVVLSTMDNYIPSAIVTFDLNVAATLSSKFLLPMPILFQTQTLHQARATRLFRGVFPVSSCSTAGAITEFNEKYNCKLDQNKVLNI
eukprot:TRINITY_DN83_c0_g2_i2.p1 TRINITY_DN83_c0_g2~~TRINITY_DN83_c0_g2_i2.p1  ORF type:complete len:482 (+),score=54.59 TRINITY_DN83_c0_g2_i2:80-1525(+)